MLTLGEFRELTKDMDDDRPITIGNEDVESVAVIELYAGAFGVGETSVVVSLAEYDDAHDATDRLWPVEC